jgi:N-acylneuraminate cytidylyltransferase
MYDMTTVAYAARPVFILREESMFKGTVKAIEIPPERAVDIDTELDFAFAEFLLATGRVSASERKVKL